MSVLTKKIAEQFNNRQYPVRISEDEQKKLEDFGVVVVIGNSDDIMSFYGAISDEVDCYSGGVAFLDKSGIMRNKCDYIDCPYHQNELKSGVAIEAVWDDGIYSWTYQTNIPHETFDILEDEEKYCRGIVFTMTDLASTEAEG